MVRCFRCARTGLYYPSDYIERWGERYGRGLGPDPVSEAFVNEYNRPLAAGRDAKRTMHPLAYCRAQLDYVEVPEEEYAAHQPIIIQDDPGLEEIGQLMRDKQLQKSTALRAAFPSEIAPAAERIAARQDEMRAIINPTPVEEAL